MGSEAEQFTQMEDKIKIPKNGKHLGNPQKEMLEKEREEKRRVIVMTNFYYNSMLVCLSCELRKVNFLDRERWDLGSMLVSLTTQIQLNFLNTDVRHSAWFILHYISSTWLTVGI